MAEVIKSIIIGELIETNNRPRNAAAVPGYARTGRGRGACRGTGRGNHREGQNVNNSNVDRRQEIR